MLKLRVILLEVRADLPAALGHMCMMIKMSNLFALVNDREKIIIGLGFNLILKRNNNDKAL